MTIHIPKIDVNALFGLRTEGPTVAELLAEDIKRSVENLKKSSDSICGNEPLDKYFSYQVCINRKMFSNDVTRERLVWSLQAYNRFVGAGQSTPITNLANPFVRTLEVVNQIQPIMTDIQHDILVNAQEQARNMALESDEVAGLSYKEREELRAHFENIREKMTVAVNVFDAGNPEEAFRIYSSALSDNAGYVSWLSRELYYSSLNNVASTALTTCYSSGTDDRSRKWCAILNLEPPQVDYSKANKNDEECCVPESVEYWPNGNVKKAKLKIDYSVRNINFYRGTVLEFYDGEKWSAEIARDQVIDGINLIKGTTVFFDKNNEIVCTILGKNQEIEGFEFYKGTYIMYYDDGQLKGAGLEVDQYINGVRFPKGTAIVFTKRSDIVFGDLDDFDVQKIIEVHGGIFRFSDGGSISTVFDATLGSDTVIQGMRFPKGTRVGFYDDGRLMTASLDKDKAIQGRMYFKGWTVLFAKSGRATIAVSRE